MNILWRFAPDDLQKPSFLLGFRWGEEGLFMNRNRVAVIIAVLFMIIVLAGGWFYLQYIMENYSDDLEKEENASVYRINEIPASFDTYLQNEQLL